MRKALRSWAAPGSWHLCSQEQEQIEDLQIRTNHLEKEKADAQLQNKQLNESLQQAQEHIFELEKKLVRYDKDKEALTVSGQLRPFPGCPGFPGGCHSALISATQLVWVTEQSQSLSAWLSACEISYGIHRTLRNQSRGQRDGMGAASCFSHHVSAGHSPPVPGHISHTSQRNPCCLTVCSCLQNAKAHLKITQKEWKDLQWEHILLE